MMKSNRIALLVFATLLIGSTLPLGAATPPKFRPSGSGDSGTGRYVITLTADAGAEDITAMKRELPLLYGAALEGNPSDVRQFTAIMTPARARLLSTDPRVSEVAEAPPASTPAAPTPTPVSQARHFTTQPSGYGDNGQSGTYTYDSSGNITAIGTDTYLYDLEERLRVSVTRGVTETYIYDAFGNRQSATGAVNCLGQTTCAQPVTLDEHTNRLQTINNGAVQYDTAGNVTTIAGTPSTTYTYDGTGMMIEQTVGSDDRQFVYTADDERIAVRQGASWTWTVRDQSDKVLREFTSMETGGSGFAMTNRQWLKDYVWRDGLLLATTTSSATLHYHLDHLGTPRLVTNGSGAKVAEHAYYPFGAEIALTPHETPEEAMKFTSHERDIVAGDGHTLDYMHARFYNPTLGRFLEVDPELGRAAEPQSWNRYAYVLNNPILRTDPNGKCFWDLCVGEALVATATVAVVATAVVWLTHPNPVDPGHTNAQVIGGTISTVATIIKITGQTLMESKSKNGSTGGETAGKRFPKTVQEQAANEARDHNGQTHCQNCGVPTSEPGTKPAPGEVKSNTDHIVPAAQGGNATLENAQHTCETCNKSAQDSPKPKTTGADRLQNIQPPL